MDITLILRMLQTIEHIWQAAKPNKYRERMYLLSFHLQQNFGASGLCVILECYPQEEFNVLSYHKYNKLVKRLP